MYCVKCCINHTKTPFLTSERGLTARTIYKYIKITPTKTPTIYETYGKKHPVKSRTISYCQLKVNTVNLDKIQYDI
ncbi:hypothetical protein DVG78_13505 [Runella aurantiaca]|uniref:Uncharacterized protein n=1 Tax=Runella aurantiaca TaxID=2282308 RepID=A0A369IDM0_9BACT|nr:hypothetical protein DVG78_13505 [Runella aurantiaca]